MMIGIFWDIGAYRRGMGVLYSDYSDEREPNKTIVICL